MKKFKLGIALGGGGARGLAHIGILDALAKGGLSIDAISGTSMGAVIGALYAVDADERAVEKKVAGFITSGPAREAACFFSKKASISGRRNLIFRANMRPKKMATENRIALCAS